jgi:MSHA pilin protein MshA
MHFMEDFMRKTQAGLSLVELVVLIALLGMISAMAIVKYREVQSQARVANAVAVYNALHEAATLAKAACQLDLAGVNMSPTCTVTGGTVKLDGTNIAMLNEYPEASLIGIVMATQLNTLANQVHITAGDQIILDIKGGLEPYCRIAYGAAPAVGAAPPLTLVTTGC